MNWTAIATSLISGVLGISAVAAFMAKYMPTVTKWVTIAKDAVETLTDVSASLAAGPLTAAEITKLQADVAQFQADLKTALGK